VTSGLIFDIKKYSIHDGPGIRTTVFLKGCPLSCWWCHNPESQSSQPEIIVHGTRCIQCGACVDACPHQAIRWHEGASPVTERPACRRCGACADACFA
jgi:pyruvate formate lyase activating enzyme